MKASELRVGNYVTTGKKEWVISVVSDSNEVRVTDGKFTAIAQIPINEIHPIPLTEEWLLKFGLNNPTNEKPYHFKKSAVEFLHSEFQDELKCFCNDKPMFSFPCKYVHQLQNIYYSITGEELKINKL